MKTRLIKSLNPALAVLLAATLAACATKKPVAPVQPVVKPAETQAQVQTPAVVDNSNAVNSGSASTNTGIDADKLAGDANAIKPPVADSGKKIAYETSLLQTRTLYFPYDGDNVGDADFRALRAHGAYLAANPSARITLHGFADERGTPEYNVALSERRGLSVRDILESSGARGVQLLVVAHGESEPADEGEDEMAWGKNRRVELDYTSAKP